MGNYRLKLLEDFVAGTGVVDELIANLVDDVVDDLNVDLAGGGSRHDGGLGIGEFSGLIRVWGEDFAVMMRG